MIQQILYAPVVYGQNVIPNYTPGDFYYDPATNSFVMNKSLTLPGNSLKIGSHVLSEDTTVDDDGFSSIGTFHCLKTVGGRAGSVCLQEGTVPITSPSGDMHRLWVDSNHDILWQDQEGVSRVVHVSGGAAPGQWTLNGNDISYSAGNVGIKITNPASSLHIVGASSPSDGIIIEATEEDRAYIYYDPNNGVVFDSFRVSDNRRLPLLLQPNGGRVGIGTINPATILDINGVITSTGGNSTNWNTAYGWGDHSLVGYLTSYSESDPVFSAWNRSTGISITESQISDLQSYLLSESDPIFSAWDKSTGISITESQISDLNHTPVFDGNIASIYNSAGDLKIMPDVQGDVILFGDTNVGDGVTGKELRIWRKAVEGNEYIRFYISATQKGFIHTSCPLTLQAQVDFTINSVTEDIIFKVGDNAGAKKFYFKDSDGTDIVTIDSNGQSYFNGVLDVSSDLIVGTDVFFADVSNGSINLGSDVTGTDRLNVFSPTTGLQTGIASFYDSSSNIKFRIRDEWTASSIPPRIESQSSLGFALNTIADAPFIWYVNGTGNEKMRLTAAGLGIGTTTPGLPLEVRLDNGQQAIFFDSTAQAEGVGGGIAFGGKYTDAGAEAMAGKIGTQKTNSTSGHVGFDMVFKTQDFEGSITERMILTSDGLCGLHVPLFSSPSKPLDVWGDARLRGNLSVDVSLIVDNQITVTNIESSGNIVAGGGSSNFRISAYINRTTGIVRSARFQTDGNHVDARGISIWAGEDTESGTNYWLEAYDGNGGTLTGGLRSVAGVFDVFNSSDRRLKKNIKNTKMIGKDIISKLKVRDFEWKSNPGHKVTGFIAQEVMKIYPNAVGEPNPETDMYGISKTAFIPPMIKYMQELEVRVSKLERN